MREHKLNLLYDASVLCDSYNATSRKSGIFFVAHNLLNEFLKSENINVELFIDISSLCHFNKYLVDQDIKSKFTIYSNTIFPLFTNKYYEISNLRKLLNKKEYPIKRFLLKLEMFLMKPLVCIFNYLGDINLANKTKNITAFLSPIYTLPIVIQNNNNIKKYRILYDLIPLILPEYKNKTHKNLWFSKLIQSINNKDYYFAISDYTRKDFLKYCPEIDPDKIKTTLLACNENFKPKTENEIKKAKAKYNIPSDKKYIFSLCTLEPRKNLIRAVKTFIQFIKKNNIEDLVFVLGGGHWDSFIGQLEKEIENLGEYKSKIIKAGYVDDADLAPLYSGAEWFVYTSQYEGFGLPPLEAMSCGCPVITSNNSSLPEVVGDSAIMVDYDSDEQHIEAYEKYYYNENSRKEYSQKGLKRASLFSWEKCANQILDIIVSDKE